MKKAITYKAISTSGTTELSTYYFEPVWGFSTESYYFTNQVEADAHMPAAKAMLLNKGMQHIIEHPGYELGIF